MLETVRGHKQLCLAVYKDLSLLHVLLWRKKKPKDKMVLEGHIF